MVSTVLALLLMSVSPAAAAQQPVDSARSDFNAGRYGEAVNKLTAALGQAPNNSELHFWLARSFYEQHRIDDAVAHAETAVRLSPDNAEYQRWLGRAYGEKADQSHSFFLARKVKSAFEAAVQLAPRSIEARRDLMQFLAEAPWIVGGSKDKAKQQVDAIRQLDPLQGRLAQAAYLAADKKWDLAQAEYAAVLDQNPSTVAPYMEAAEFFAGRKDAPNLERAVNAARRIDSHDPRVEFYRAVMLVLRGADALLARDLLNFYITSVPERSDYPSHAAAKRWLAALGK